MNGLLESASVSASTVILLSYAARSGGERLGPIVPVLNLHAVAFAGVAIVACILARGTSVYENASVAVALGSAAVCAVSDIRCGYIFDRVTVPTITLLVAIAYAGNFEMQAVIGAVCAGGTIWVLNASSGGRGIGLGDAKLAALLGAALGPVGSMVTLGLAFVGGAVIAIAGLLSGRFQRGDRMRFAPYMALGACAYVLFSGVVR